MGKMKKKTKKIKKWKKIKNFTLVGLISSAIVGTIGIILNNKKTKTNVKSSKNNYQTLVSKIKDKDLIIDKDVNTSTDAKILVAIKNQLKVENPLLNDEDLSKINDNITSLVPGIKTNVVLTILIDNKSNTINIKVTRPLSDFESISAVKNALKSLSFKEISIVATSGTITDNKKAITNDLNLLIKSSNIDLKGTNILVKEEDTELTLKGVPFTILISKGSINQEIGSEFVVKRVENNAEKNKEKIAFIKAKIKVKTFYIEKNVDTSSDTKTLLAIKNQLKKENPLLSDQDLSKIDDNITSLVPNKQTPVSLIISIGSQKDNVKIWIERPLSDLESVDKTKNALEIFALKQITISATFGTITDNKDLILKALKKKYLLLVILSSFGSNISIEEEDTELTLEGVPFTILVSRGNITKKIISTYVVKRSKTIQEKNKDKVTKIKSKIVNKNLIIAKNVNTSNDATTLLAIKNQLKKRNPLLNNEEVSKIDDNIISLDPEKRTPVILKISVGDETDTVKIWIIRSLSDSESIDVVKNALENLSSKEITISAISGTITDRKAAISNALNSLINSLNIDKKGTIISIKNENTELTLNGVPFTILISKGTTTKEIVSTFIVKRSLTNQEIILKIKSKIKNKILTIPKNVNTSNDAKTLLAIKNQLKIQNPSLNDEDVAKITDNISSLIPGVKTNVVLTISVGSKSNVIKIEVNRPLNDLELVNNVKNKLEKISSKEITISTTSGTITNNKKAISSALNSLINSLNIDLKGTDISIKEEDTKITLLGIPFTIKITKENITKQITSIFIVKRSKTIQEINNHKINTIKNKITDKELIINKDVDTSNDAKILLAIKNQLKNQNPLLENDDLLKITDNITSLIPGVKTNVVLTILVNTESENINVQVIRPLSDLESVSAVKNEFAKISQKIIVNVTSGTITNNKKAIFSALNSLINSLNIDLKGTDISIKEEDTKLTLSGVPFTILISKGSINQKITSKFIVARIKSIQEIKSKITNKELIINKDVDTTNDAKIFLAIKNQLKTQNPLLDDEDLSKITDNITSLTPEVKTNVILTISVNTKSDTVNIQVTRPLNNLESVNAVKNTFAKLPQKAIVKITSGTISDNKKVITDSLDLIIKFSNLDLKGTNVSIKEENTQITLSGVFVKILISKEGITQEVISKVILVKIKSTEEIKNKITNKELIISKNVDTSNDAKILLAIKNQLKVENPLLNDQDLLKITDNITSLVPEVKTNVVLTISVGSESDTVNIQVTRPLSDLETINIVKNTFSKISQKIRVRVTSGTITDNKKAITIALNSLINSLNLDLKGTNVSIKEENTQITLGGQYVKILISKGDITEESTLKAIAVLKRST